MTLQDFINQNTGAQGVGDTPQNIGQCVGLDEVWTDSLNLPHTWGNAIDLLNNVDPNSFTVTYNNLQDTTQFPIDGSLVIFGKPYGLLADGTYAGHTGISIGSDGNILRLFEQNDPEGSTPQIKEYPYDNCIGWATPKITTVQPTPVTPVTPDPLQPELDQCRVDRDNHWNDLQAAKTTLDNLNQQINDRNNNITTLNGQVSTLQTVVTATQQEVDTLKPIAIQVPQLKEQLAQAVNDKSICLTAQEGQNRKIAGLESAFNAKKPITFIDKLRFLLS